MRAIEPKDGGLVGGNADERIGEFVFFGHARFLKDPTSTSAAGGNRKQAAYLKVVPYGVGVIREGQVVEAGDAEHGLMETVALESAVPQDLPVLQPGQGVLDASAGLAMHLALGLPLRAQTLLTSLFAVRDESSGALVAAVGDDRGGRGRPGRCRTR